MKLSKKTEYALRAVVAIAKVRTGKPVPIGELAEAEGIPLKFLEQILLVLKNGGVLSSKRGVGGGYQLARPAERITLGEVVGLIDGPFEPWGEEGLGSGLAEVFAELKGTVDGFLGSHTVQDAVQREQDRDAMPFEI